jgi:DNA processing protein
MAEKESLEIAKILGKTFASQGSNVISGLARGVDKYAHLGALETGTGRTIAVLGNGIEDENIYPYENKKVFERILESGGTIISEYPIGTKPARI